MTTNSAPAIPLRLSRSQRALLNAATAMLPEPTRSDFMQRVAAKLEDSIACGTLSTALLTSVIDIVKGELGLLPPPPSEPPQ